MCARASSTDREHARPFAWRNNNIDAVQAAFALQRQNHEFATRIGELNLR